MLESSLTLIFLFSSTVGPTLAAMTYLYDANGNMTSDGEKCFHYNEANQMDKVTNCSNGQTIAEYVYDYTGKRIVKREFTNGVLTKTVYSPNDEFEKTIIASNSAVQDITYYKVNDETIAKKDASGNKTYFHNDHLGSNNVSTNQSGVVVEETTYEPYGEVKSGGAKSKFQYTGQEKDGETGLNYYDSRYYDPHIHRFIQPDTWLPDIYDPQQLNRYSYANNNPLRYTDPSGHFIKEFIFEKLLPKVLPKLSSLWNNVKNFIKKPETKEKVVNTKQNQPQKTDPVLQKNNPLTNLSTNTPQIPKATDPKLQNLINNNLYKGANNPNRIGSGSTADAIRNEALTGQQTFGKWHKTQGLENINALNNWLKTHPNASEADIKVANTIKIDIMNALQGK